jgi:hypothetical protein
MACFNLADGVVICNSAGVSVTIPEGGGAKAITAFLDAHWDAEVAANTPAVPLVVSADIAALVVSADIAAPVGG